MTNNYDTDDTFLARWIAGELSEEERVAFEKTEVFKQFDIINKASLDIERPIIDTEAALKKVKSQLKTQTKRPRTIRLWSSIAAAAILLISAGLFMNSTKTYTTAIGEQLTITLNDGSTVNMNANSSLSHKRFSWSGSMDVQLRGEAFFMVTKGSDFKVHTSKGIVSVLGTQFNIRDRSSFVLKCYEGKVSFTRPNTQVPPYILTKGTSLSFQNNRIEEKTFQGDKPLWKNGVSEFENQPLSVVLEALSNQYPIQFDLGSVNTDRLYTGSFKHNDLETALKATLTPMGITYETNKTNTNIIFLSE